MDPRTEIQVAIAPELIATEGRASGFWSFITTEESIDRRQINFWAIIETIASIITFWIIALKFQTLAFIYVSLFFAPLLLLRSKASVKQGVKWFESGIFPTKLPVGIENTTERELILRNWKIQSICISICIIFIPIAISMFFVSYKIGNYDTFYVIGSSALIAAIVVSILSIIIFNLIKLLRTGVPSVYLTTNTWWVSLYTALSLYKIRTMILYIFAPVLYYLIDLFFGYSSSESLRAAIFCSISLPLFHIASFAIFIPLYALIVRLMAAFKYPADGYLSIPDNIFKLSMCTTSLFRYELVPGLPSRHRFKFRQVLSNSQYWISQKSAVSIIIGVASVLPIPFWYLPGIFYRFSLKSTMWLWWILFLIAGGPDVRDGIAGLKVDFKEKHWTVFTLLISAASLIFFCIAKLTLPYFVNQHSEAPLIPVVAFFAAINWLALSTSSILGLVSSTLTIGVWFWADGIIKDSALPSRAASVEIQMQRFGYVNKWKTGLGYLTIALIMIYVALYTNATYQYWPISPWVAEKLHWIYGANANALVLRY